MDRNGADRCRGAFRFVPSAVPNHCVTTSVCRKRARLRSKSFVSRRTHGYRKARPHTIVNRIVPVMNTHSSRSSCLDVRISICTLPNHHVSLQIIVCFNKMPLSNIILLICFVYYRATRPFSRRPHRKIPSPKHHAFWVPLF